MNPRGHEAARVACGLAEDVVHTFGKIRLRVFGTSMVPSILPGDLITVQQMLVSDISSGEVVLYARDGRMFAHRVVGCAASPRQPFARNGESLLITRGDLLAHNDPPVSSSELLGKVISIQRGDRQIKTFSPPGALSRASIRLLRTSSRATYLYVKLASLWRMLAACTFLSGRKDEEFGACVKIEDPCANGTVTRGPEDSSRGIAGARPRPLENEAAAECPA
jgi:signal peptidase I